MEPTGTDFRLVMLLFMPPLCLTLREQVPLQLEIKKEGQKLGGSTTPVGNQAKTSPTTIVEVSKNLSLLCLQHISSWPKQERAETIASRVESHVSSSGLHARKCLTKRTSIRYNIARIILLREIKKRFWGSQRACALLPLQYVPGHVFCVSILRLLHCVRKKYGAGDEASTGATPI